MSGFKLLWLCIRQLPAKLAPEGQNKNAVNLMAARGFLTVIAHEPEAVSSALATNNSNSSNPGSTTPTRIAAFSSPAHFSPALISPQCSTLLPCIKASKFVVKQNKLLSANPLLPEAPVVPIVPECYSKFSLLNRLLSTSPSTILAVSGDNPGGLSLLIT